MLMELLDLLPQVIAAIQGEESVVNAGGFCLNVLTECLLPHPH